MGQRNMVYTGPMIDTEIEHAHLHPEPCVIPYGRISSFPQPNYHLPPPGNSQGPLPSGITQYNSVGSNMLVAAPPGARLVPVSFGPGLHNQLPFPTNQVMDGFNGAFKGKITEGFPVNFQYFYPAPGSSSFVVPEYRGNNVVPVVMGPGHHRGARNIATGAIGLDPGLQFMPLIHGGQPLQVVPAPWLDQQFCGNAPGIPYMQGYTNGYQVMTTDRNPVAFVHVASHPPPPPMPPMRGSHNMDLHPQLASASLMVPLQNGVELVPRFVGLGPPIGVRLYQPHRQELMVESTPRHGRFPHLRVLPEDGVAILDMSNYGHTDHHIDMRLDIDHMSYEELLALGEQIGSVGSGLSDDFILGHLKTRTFASSESSSHREDVSSADQELNFCTICQMDYNDQEKIGVLGCSHEYHVDCIKKWLGVKNTCPVCKSTALATQGKESGNLKSS